MLTPADILLLQSSYAKVQAGDIAGAQASLATLPDAKLQHPDVMHLLAMIMMRLNEPEEARAFLEHALGEAPKSAQIWVTYGNLLGDIGEVDAAITAFERAGALDPQSVDPWLNLGITALDAGRLEEAATALDRATQMAPQSVPAWNTRGLVEQQRGVPEVAAEYFQRALLIDPHDARSRHNLGVALRRLDQGEAAIEQIELAIAAGSQAPESFTMRAHLLAALGRFDDAVGQYREVVKAVPDHLDAHETLARLLPQLGQSDTALDSYRAALDEAPGSLVLWRSALAAATDLKDYRQLLAWAEDAEHALGPHEEFALARATALRSGGDAATAVDLLRSLAGQNPDNAAIHNHLAHTLLMLGDPSAAERHALRATALAPFDQSGWSYLTIIWRLLDDAREHWLADYERLVMPIDIYPPDDEDSAGRLAELSAMIGSLHLTSEHPAEQSLRGGTQTRGNIFDKRHPDLRGFADHIRAAVEARLATLPIDDHHPFLGRNHGPIAFAGSWSVRLRSAGFHINHIHHSGWLSSAFYVSLPPEVGTSPAGALTFGVPDATLGLDLPPRRIELPRAGKLLIFPSYLWHGTLPFESASPRLTLAFDAVPASSQ